MQQLDRILNDCISISDICCSIMHSNIGHNKEAIDEDKCNDIFVFYVILLAKSEEYTKRIIEKIKSD